MYKTMKSSRRKVSTSMILLGISILALQGCGSMPNTVYNGSTDCGYIGCSTGGLRVYPFPEDGAVRLRRDMGWEWGKTSSAYHPSDPKHWELRKQECARAADLGLDCNGRPLRH